MSLRKYEAEDGPTIEGSSILTLDIQRTLTTFFYMARMALSFPGIAINFYFKRKRAVGFFKKELIANGVSSLEAEEIAEMYPFKLSDMFRMLFLRD